MFCTLHTTIHARPRLRFAIMGALACCIWALPGRSGDAYVDGNNATPLSPFDSWENAATHIQEAVDQAADNATVWIRSGRYTLPPVYTNFQGPNVVYVNRPMTLRSESGKPADVRIDGEGQNRVITLNSPSGAGTTFALIGLTLTNGFTTGNGGGLLLEGSTGQWHTDVLDSVITHNVSTGSGGNDGGGGVYGRWTTGYSSIIFSNTVLRANQATGLGGGMRYRVYSMHPTVISDGARFIDCLIEHNSSPRGGGVYREPHAHMHFERTILRYNTASISGGALDMRGDGEFLLRNCLLHHNSTVWGAVYLNDGKGVKVFENTTIAHNSGTGHGIYVHGGDTRNAIDMKNTIVYGNGNANLFIGSTVILEQSLFLHSLISPTNDLPGAGNLDVDPAFVNVAGGDFRLTQDSPAVNAGTNLTWMAEGIDLVGNPRLDGLYRQADIGAYEYHYRGTTLLVR